MSCFVAVLSLCCESVQNGLSITIPPFSNIKLRLIVSLLAHRACEMASSISQDGVDSCFGFHSTFRQLPPPSCAMKRPSHNQILLSTTPASIPLEFGSIRLLSMKLGHGSMNPVHPASTNPSNHPSNHPAKSKSIPSIHQQGVWQVVARQKTHSIHPKHPSAQRTIQASLAIAIHGQIPSFQGPIAQSDTQEHQSIAH